MKSASIASVLALAVSGANAADSDQAAFLTNLVSDYDSHKTEYLNFFKTATGYPPELRKLAMDVRTYKDDSYTTILDDSDYNFSSLSAYATNLPWYSRLEGKEGSGSGSGSSSGSGSGSSSSSGSGSSSSGSSSSSAGSTSGGAGSAVVVPVGAALGAFAIALL